MEKVICVVCPKGCRLTVCPEGDLTVTGHGCKRGEVYGKKEVTNPTRVITSTVKISGGLYPRCSVKTDRDIPKRMIMEAVSMLSDVVLEAPVHIGDVVVADVCGTGARFIATKNMDKVEK